MWWIHAMVFCVCLPSITEDNVNCHWLKSRGILLSDFCGPKQCNMKRKPEYVVPLTLLVVCCVFSLTLFPSTERLHSSAPQTVGCVLCVLTDSLSLHRTVTLLCPSDCWLCAVCPHWLSFLPQNGYTPLPLRLLVVCCVFSLTLFPCTERLHSSAPQTVGCVLCVLTDSLSLHRTVTLLCPSDCWLCAVCSHWLSFLAQNGYTPLPLRLLVVCCVSSLTLFPCTERLHSSAPQTVGCVLCVLTDSLSLHRTVTLLCPSDCWLCAVCPHWLSFLAQNGYTPLPLRLLVWCCVSSLTLFPSTERLHSSAPQTVGCVLCVLTDSLSLHRTVTLLCPSDCWLCAVCSHWLSFLAQNGYTPLPLRLLVVCCLFSLTLFPSTERLHSSAPQTVGCVLFVLTDSLSFHRTVTLLCPSDCWLCVVCSHWLSFLPQNGYTPLPLRLLVVCCLFSLTLFPSTERLHSSAPQTVGCVLFVLTDSLSFHRTVTLLCPSDCWLCAVCSHWLSFLAQNGYTPLPLRLLVVCCLFSLTLFPSTERLHFSAPQTVGCVLCVLTDSLSLHRTVTLLCPSDCWLCAVCSHWLSFLAQNGYTPLPLRLLVVCCVSSLTLFPCTERLHSSAPRTVGCVLCVLTAEPSLGFFQKSNLPPAREN